MSPVHHPACSSGYIDSEGCPHPAECHPDCTFTQPQVVCAACGKPISLKEVPLCAQCRQALAVAEGKVQP